MHLKKLLESEYLALAILLMITLPVVVHTRTLLLEITQFRDAPRWIRELYAIFFAVSFDCSIFMFAVYGMKAQAKAFAVMTFIVGWMFWNNDILFVEIHRPEANTAQLWSRIVMGTLWSAFSAYLVYWCSEMFAQRLASTPVAGNPVQAENMDPVKVSHVKRRKRRSTAAPALPKNGHSRAEKAIIMKDAGKANKEIAAALGVSEKTVQRDLQKVAN